MLQNTTNAQVLGHVYFRDPAGALLGTLPFSIGPRGGFVVNTSTVSGVSGQSGTLTVSHNGGYAALVGKAVAVETTTGFTFDAALEPRRH